MATSILRKSDVPVVDMLSADDEYKAIRASVAGEYRGRAVSAVHQYVMGVAVNRRVKAGDSQSDLVSEYGVPQSMLNKLNGVTRVLDSHVNGDDKAFENLPNVDREKVAEQRKNLTTYWGHVWDGREDAPSFLGTASGLIGDSGEDRARALVAMWDTFGSPSSAYQVAIGAKIHENDPRNEDNEGEQDDQDGEQDAEPTPWQDRLAALVAQAKLEGATASDILRVVNDALKA